MNDISNEFNNHVWYPVYRINIFTDSVLKLYLLVNRRDIKKEI